MFCKKVIARENEREYLDAHEDDIFSFISDGVRNDFDDVTVICVKFLVADNPDMVDAEETNWFVNPNYSGIQNEPEFKLVICEFLANNPKYQLASEFVPEVLLLPTSNEYDVLQSFESFRNSVLSENLSDADMFERFCDYLQTEKY